MKRSCERTEGRRRKEGRISSLVPSEKKEKEKKKKKKTNGRGTCSLSPEEKREPSLRVREPCTGREDEANLCPGWIESERETDGKEKERERGKGKAERDARVCEAAVTDERCVAAAAGASSTGPGPGRSLDVRVACDEDGESRGRRGAAIMGRTGSPEESREKGTGSFFFVI